jgi:hypothetical protein
MTSPIDGEREKDNGASTVPAVVRAHPQLWTPGRSRTLFGFAFQPPGSTAGSGLRGVVWLGQGKLPISA